MLTSTRREAAQRGAGQAADPLRWSAPSSRTSASAATRRTDHVARANSIAAESSGGVRSAFDQPADQSRSGPNRQIPSYGVWPAATDRSMIAPACRWKFLVPSGSESATWRHNALGSPASRVPSAVGNRSPLRLRTIRGHVCRRGGRALTSTPGTTSAPLPRCSRGQRRANSARQRLGPDCCCSHIQHVPQQTLNGTTTRSPTFSDVTAEPISSTMPIGSWPTTSPASMKGAHVSQQVAALRRPAAVDPVPR